MASSRAIYENFLFVFVRNDYAVRYDYDYDYDYRLRTEYSTAQNYYHKIFISTRTKPNRFWFCFSHLFALLCSMVVFVLNHFHKKANTVWYFDNLELIRAPNVHNCNAHCSTYKETDFGMQKKYRKKNETKICGMLCKRKTKRHENQQKMR